MYRRYKPRWVLSGRHVRVGGLFVRDRHVARLPLGAVGLAVIASLGTLACAARVRAFSDYERYSAPTSEGGTDGRHFTGSPVDGYGCNACHRGGEPIGVSVTGLPLDGYQPGASYEVVVRFEHPDPKASMVLEFADEQGRPAGTIGMPELPTDPNLADISEFCVDMGMVTAFGLFLIDTEDGRSIATVPDCGARAMRFVWTAPAAQVGTIWMAGGVVNSDEGADPEGDGVTLLRRPLLSEAGQAYAREVASGCSVARGGRHRATAALGPLFGCMLLWAFGISVTRRRRSSRTEQSVKERT